MITISVLFVFKILKKLSPLFDRKNTRQKIYQRHPGMEWSYVLGKFSSLKIISVIPTKEIKEVLETVTFQFINNFEPLIVSGHCSYLFPNIPLLEQNEAHQTTQNNHTHRARYEYG